MPTSKAGISARQAAGAGKSGFTLLELMLVMVILGITAVLVFPKLSAFGAGDLKRTIRHLSGMIEHLAQEASSTKQTYRLHYDLEEGAYWADILQNNREFGDISDSLVKRRKLPKGITFQDVITPRHGKIESGKAYTVLFPMGVEKSTIHLKKENHTWTLTINPLTGRVKVHDRYVE